MGRLILGILAGIVAAFAAIWAVEMVHHLVYPVPRGVTLTDTAGLARYIESMTLTQMLFIAAGWLVGAAVGGIVAWSIARREAALWTVAGLVALAGIANILYVSHPLFLQLSSVVAPLIGGLIARAVVRSRGAATRPAGAGAA
jgi:hypothetical protein